MLRSILGAKVQMKVNHIISALEESHRPNLNSAWEVSHTWAKSCLGSQNMEGHSKWGNSMCKDQVKEHMVFENKDRISKEEGK